MKRIKRLSSRAPIYWIFGLYVAGIVAVSILTLIGIITLIRDPSSIGIFFGKIVVGFRQAIGK